MKDKKILSFAEKKFGPKVKEILENPNKFQAISNKINSSEIRQRLKDKFKDSYEDFLLLISLIKDWIKGDYKKIPWKSLWLCVLCVVYVFSVIDFIPDFILGVGLLDDLTLLTYVLRSIKSDLDEYREFKEYTEVNSSNDS